MPSITDHGVCVRHWDWSETSQTVCILARDHGILRALAKGSRRERSRFAGGIELLAYAELGAITKPAGSLHVLTSWDPLETFPACRDRLARHNAAMYLAELTGLAVQDDDPHPRLFDALLAALRALGNPHRPAADAEIPGVLLTFLWTVLVETGHKPELARHAATGDLVEPAPTLGFSPVLGGVLPDPGPSPPSRVWRVRAETIARLRALEAALPHPPPSPADDRAARLLGSYLRERLEIDPQTHPGVFPVRDPDAHPQ